MQLTKQSIIDLLRTNDKAVLRALIVLNDRQTQDERVSEHTRYLNKQGFNAAHAKRGTSMVKFFNTRGYLTDAQIAWWRGKDARGNMRIGLYANQLLDAAKLKIAAQQMVKPPHNTMGVAS